MSKSLFEQALALEGTSPEVAKIARSIYQQESGSGSNTKTSNAGAVGGMQIIGPTFASVADKDWDINDPLHNARAGIRYVTQGYTASGGNAALTGAYYYGGPGGMEKARKGIAVSDPRNPKAPTTLEYGAQVAARAGLSDEVPAVAPPLAPEPPARPEGWPVLPTARQPREGRSTASQEALLAASNAQTQALIATDGASRAQTTAAIATDEALQARKDSTGFADVFQAGRRDARLQPLFSALDYIDREQEQVPADWSYAAIRDEVEAGLTDDEREYLRENATGPQALQQAQGQLAYRRELDEQYGLAGGFSAFAGQMAAGMMDPVGFALGMGVGKAIQSVGIGSRALAAAGRSGAATTSFLAENALANVSVELMQDAMGEVKTSADYALAGASGALLAAPFTKGALRTGQADGVVGLVDEIKTKAVKEQMDAVAAVVRETGETDPVKVAREVERRELDAIMQDVNEATKPNPIRDQVVPEDVTREQRAEFAGTPVRQEEATTVAPTVDPATTPDAVPEAVEVPLDPALFPTERIIPTKAGYEVSLALGLPGKEIKVGDRWVYSTRDVLKQMRDLGGDTVGQIDYFLKALSKDVLEVPISMQPARKRGAYWPAAGTIAAPAKGAVPSDLPATLKAMTPWERNVVLHEVTHAATFAKLEAYNRQPDAVSPTIRAAAEQLTDLFERFKQTPAAAAMRAAFPEIGAGYASKDIHEFAAQMWSDSSTREVLKGMAGKPVAGRPSSAWTEMLNILARILGFGKDGLTEGMRLLDTIITTSDTTVRNLNMDELVVSSPQAQAASTRRQAERLWQHAQSFMQQNPINVERLKVITAKFGGMSDGLVLAASKNPVLQMVASLVTETTTGAAGRKANVAVRTHMLHKRLMGNMLPDYVGGFEVWNRATGGNTWDSVMVGAKRREFDRLVYDELLSRRDPNHTPNPDGNIVRAADAAEGLFERARVAQIEAGTLGADNLPGHSRGYVPQALDGTKLQELSVADLHLLHGELSHQFQSRLGWDKPFADLFAPYYTDRIRKRAQGDKGIDGLSAGGDAGQVVRDTLEDMSIDPAMRDRAEAANKARAGLGQTKKRLDLDLRAQLRPGLQMADLYVTDPLTLGRSYARRTAGNVALTESGILGIRGVRALREAAGQPFADGTLPTQAELDAFDRVMAEIMGTPVAGQVVSAGATNLGLLVGLQRLGGLVFTQAAETMQLIHHLGFRSLLSGVASLPAHLGDVGRLKKGLPPERHLLTSIEQYGGEIGTDAYKMVAPLDPPDARLEQYMEQSGVLSRLLRGGGHLQSKISGFRGLMAAQHRMAAEQILMKAARFIRDGGEDVALRDMGFTKEVTDSLRQDLQNVAKWGANGRLQSFDLTQVSDPRTAEAFVQAVHRGTSQIIQGTFIGERNKWLHNDYLRLMLQLRVFGLTAAEKQWGRTRMNHSYSYVAGMMLGQMLLVAPIHAARVQLASAGRDDREKYIKENMHWANFGRALMNYSSLSGLMGDVMEVGSGVVAGWGGKDAQELLGARQQSGGVGRIIPAAGTLDALQKVATGKANAYTALKQLPFSSLWYLAPAINLAKEK